MPKPGKSPNVADPHASYAQGIADADRVGMGSRQNAATAQTASMNPNRLIPRIMPAGPHGRADVEVSGIMEEQGRKSDTESTGYNYGLRKQRLVSNP